MTVRPDDVLQVAGGVYAVRGGLVSRYQLAAGVVLPGHGSPHRGPAREAVARALDR